MEQVDRLIEHGVDGRGLPARDEPPGTPGSPAPELECRPLSIRDIPSLLGDFELERYQLPESLVAGRGLIRSSLASLRPLWRGQPRTLVGIDQGRIAAFVEFQPAGRDSRWIAMGAGYLTSLSSPADAVEEVLRYAVKAAGQRHVKRLYARLPMDAELSGTYQRVGFQTYATETVWMAERPVVVAASDLPPLRAQEATDTWAVHQLYNATVPRDVQYAEASTSNRWELSHHGRRGGIVRGYLLEDGHQLAAYARVLSCGEAHHLEVMFDPELRVDRAAFLRVVLARTQQFARLRQVYVAVRSYQQELEGTLEQLGFRSRLRQRCTIRYTAVRVQAESLAVNVALAEVRERVPKQVPTFLRRRPPKQTTVV